MGYFTAAPICIVIELSMRATIKTSHIRSLYPPLAYGGRLGTGKQCELQPAIHAKLRLQGQLRALARAVSYMIPVGGLLSIGAMYTWGNCTSVESNLYIVGLLIYTICVQDPFINAPCQFLLLRLSRAEDAASPHDGGRGKLLVKLVMKEVRELTEGRDAKVVPAECTVDLLRSLNSMAQNPDSPACKNGGPASSSTNVAMDSSSGMQSLGENRSFSGVMVDYDATTEKPELMHKARHMIIRRRRRRRGTRDELVASEGQESEEDARAKSVTENRATRGMSVGVPGSAK